MCGRPDKARQPLTHPQLAMMHFVYEIRVTLSTKIFMFSGLATTLLAHGTRRRGSEPAADDFSGPR